MSPLLAWSLRSPWRSPVCWGLLGLGVLAPPMLNRALHLSILDGGTQGAPLQWGLLAGLAGSLLGLRQLDRGSWILARRRALALPREATLLLAPALAAMGLALLLGWPWWGLPGLEPLAGAVAQVVQWSLLGTLLWTLGLRDLPLMVALPLAGWVVPAALAGWGSPGPYLAASLSGGAWPASTHPGVHQAPALASILGLALVTMAARRLPLPALAPPHAVRDPR
ncbi:MAG: hypothetical protein ISQ08_04195 [Planctomycetes bacterium]|nr:hypothetical protein [Planctomycetota bacterium]